VHKIRELEQHLVEELQVRVAGKTPGLFSIVHRRPREWQGSLSHDLNERASSWKFLVDVLEP
jgi:hypothetical protein